MRPTLRLASEIWKLARVGEPKESAGAYPAAEFLPAWPMRASLPSRANRGCRDRTNGTGRGGKLAIGASAHSWLAAY
jgi:hypothetical protein